jgi:hypothetical protein
VAAHLSFLPTWHHNTQQPHTHTNSTHPKQPPAPTQLQADMLLSGVSQEPPAPVSASHRGESMELPWLTCVDYCNGGPVFTLDPTSLANASGEHASEQASIPALPHVQSGDPRTGSLFTTSAERVPEGCTVLARYRDVGPDAIAAVRFVGVAQLNLMRYLTTHW